jgi:hypothetical protein
LRVQLAQFRIGLSVGIVVHAARTRVSEDRAASLAGPLARDAGLHALACAAAALTATARRVTPTCPATGAALTGIRRALVGVRTAPARLILVFDPLDVRAAVALQLRFDPIDRRTIAIRSLPPIAELREPFNRGLVFFQLEPADESFDRIIASGWLLYVTLSTLGTHRGCPCQQAGRDGDRQSLPTHLRPPPGLQCIVCRQRGS